MRFHLLWIPVAVCLLLVPSMVSTAYAHALTGTSVGTVVRVNVDVDQLSGSYEVQVGDLASMAMRKAVDVNGDDLLQFDEERRYLDSLAQVWSQGLAVRVDGEYLPVQLQAGQFTPRGGRASMAIPMALLFDWQTGLKFADRRRSLQVRDDNPIVGAVHRTAVISSGDLIDLVGGDIPGHLKGIQVEGFDGQVEVSVDFVPSTQAWVGPDDDAPPSSAMAQDLLGEGGPAIWVWLLALALGALHALAPGHGKTMVAAYLIGERGTTRHALLLGVIVATTHVASVGVLGMSVVLIGRWLPLQQVTPWMTTGVGVFIIGLGSWLLVRHLAAVAHVAHHGHQHGHKDQLSAVAHDGHPQPQVDEVGAVVAANAVRSERHAHPHAHEHVHEHIHVHIPSTVTMRGLLLLGLSGGILPCASALALLLMAISEGRLTQGLLLLLAFSIGVAVVLGAVGVVVVRAGKSTEHRHPSQGANGWSARLPVLSALLICFMGLLTIARGLMEAGILILRW